MDQRDDAAWFRSVIPATDFSATDRIAGRFAALFAHHFNAKLIVAHSASLQQAALEAEAL